MESYTVYTANGKGFIINADSVRFVREKGGSCRYELYKEKEIKAIFSADFVLAVIGEEG